MKFSHRAFLIVPWLLFALIALGWCGYWFVLADGAEKQLANWRAAQARNGGEASYSRVVRHGFPVLMRLEIDDFRYRAPRAGWTLATPRVDLNLEMTNPQHIIFEAKAPLTLTNPKGAVSTLAAREMVVSYRTDRGALVQAGIEADDLTLRDAKPGVFSMRKMVANLRPDPRAANQFQIAFEGANVTLARPVRSFESFGQTIATLQAGIVIEQGAALSHPSPDDPLAAWRATGGKARLEGLTLNWGPLETTGTGELGVDDAHRLTGALRVRLEHPGPAVAALAQSPNLSNDAKQALDLISLGLTLSGKHVKFDVDARDGELRIENARVRALDPMY